LSAASLALEEGSIVSIDPPGHINASDWQESMKSIAKNRPYIWPNHQDAIAQGLAPAHCEVSGRSFRQHPAT